MTTEREIELSQLVSVRDLTIRNLRERVAELEAALEPLARYAECLPPVIPGFHRATDDGVILSASVEMRDYQLTYAHLRACRHARSAVPALADRHARLCEAIVDHISARPGHAPVNIWNSAAQEYARRIRIDARRP